MPEIILPGTYITVRDEGLITAGRVVTGNIGIVGTANKGPVNDIQIISTFTEAKEIFGETEDGLTLINALKMVFNNGGRTVYAVRTAQKDLPKAAECSIKSDIATLSLQAKTVGTWGNQIKITVESNEIQLVYNNVKEAYSGVDVAEQIKKRSNLVNVNTSPSAKKADASAALAFTNGSNGEAPLAKDYGDSLVLIENELVNIVVLAGQDAKNAEMNAALQGHIKITAENKRERIAIVGCNGDSDISAVAAHDFDSDRIVYVGPGISETQTGAYTAAAVAGLLSSLPVQTSPTNKTLVLEGLAANYSSSKLEKLVMNRVLAIEKQNGFRVVKGITTATNSAWHQITTRRIVDFAIYGVRSSCNPYIGKLNNDRVRSAMKATLDGFLTRMVDDEALIGYQLVVSATRAQEVAGEVMVTMTLQPTFSIDFIRVTMYLG